MSAYIHVHTNTYTYLLYIYIHIYIYVCISIFKNTYRVNIERHGMRALIGSHACSAKVSSCKTVHPIWKGSSPQPDVDCKPRSIHVHAATSFSIWLNFRAILPFLAFGLRVPVLKILSSLQLSQVNCTPLKSPKLRKPTTPHLKVSCAWAAMSSIQLSGRPASVHSILDE